MSRELSSARPEAADQALTAAANSTAPLSFRKLATRKVVVGTAAFAALAAAAGLGAAAPAMTAAADSGSTDTAAKATAAAATALNVQDLMDRTLTTGFGAAELGGAWSSYGATFSVTGGQGHMAGIRPGVTARATLEGVQVRDEGVSVTFSVPAIPSAGSGSFFGVLLRRQANGDAVYARVKVAPGGTATVATKLIAGSTNLDLGPAYTLPTPLVAGSAYVLDAVATGGSTAAVAARLYPFGAATPGWQSSGNAPLDTAMATKGSVGLYSYAASNGGNFGVDVDGVRGQDLTAPVTTPPSSTPTSTSPSSTPTSPSSTPTSTSPSSSPTSSAPSSDPTGSNPPVGTDTAAPTNADVDGGIGFATSDPSTPVSTPPTTPVSTPPTTSTPPPPPVGKPGADNTGVPAGTNLTVYNGNITASTPGQVIQNLDIRGSIRVMAANVTVRNCIVRGTPIVDGQGGSPRSMITNLGHLPNLQVVDSELAPSQVSYLNQAGIQGSDFTLTRVDIHGSIDGITVLGDNVRVQNSWIHDTTYINSIPQQGGRPSHNDGIAIIGGSNIVLTNNTWERTTGSVMQMAPVAGYAAIHNMSWTDNWIDGGTCSLNISAGLWGTLTPITLTGNRFGQNQTIHGCAVIANQTNTPLILSGNVWDANDQPVAISRGA